MKKLEYDALVETVNWEQEIARGREFRAQTVVKAEALEKALNEMAAEGFQNFEYIPVNNAITVIGVRMNPSKISVEEEPDPTAELPVTEETPQGEPDAPSSSV